MYNREQIDNKIKLIINRMLQTRPRKDVVLRPYIKPDFVKRNLGHSVEIYLNQLFPKSKDGDYAYITVSLKASDTADYCLMTRGADKVWVNDAEVDVSETYIWHGEKKYSKTIIGLRKGFNKVVFRCTYGSGDFFLDYLVSHLYYDFLWICDYLMWVRDTVPVEEYADEQGFSVSELIKAGLDKSYRECGIVFPQESKDDSYIDFGLLFGQAKGDTAYAVSWVKEDGELEIKSKCGLIAYINGKRSESLKVSKGDSILIAVKRNQADWSFKCGSNSILHLPQVTSVRKNGVHWLVLGAMNDVAPIEIQFVKPYSDAEGQPVFWRFADKDVYLRPYLDTAFFGQWFYGLMIGEYGLLRVSEHGMNTYGYFRDSMSILARYYLYMQYDSNLFGDASFLKRSVRTDNLDAIGTIGMNLYELYIRESDKNLRSDIRYVLDSLADSVYKYIPRMKDGTFYRLSTMWLDDTYMSCPFLVRMGNLTGDSKYYDEVVLQLKNYKSYLYMEDENIFSHIYFPADKRANRVPWGRGNGWVYLSLAETIEHLPDEYAGKTEIVDIYKKAVEGLVKLQGENGLWHQVLNRPETYSETSCTAIFAVALSKGVKVGVLDRDKYLPIIRRAVGGLLENSVDENGDIHGVCRGSGCSYDSDYYAQLGTVCNDDHGTGIVITAICELLELENLQ